MGNENKKPCLPINNEITCPKNHLLKLFTTDHADFACDICSKKMLNGSEMWGCRSCNWDSCAACVASARFKEWKLSTPMETSTPEEEKLSTVNILKIPTSGQISKYRQPLKQRIRFWMSTFNTKKRAKSKAERLLKNDALADTVEERDEPKEQWRVGDKGWSQILNGPHAGKWVDVLVTRVDLKTGLLDLSIPNFKKYEVFSSACKVSADYVRRTPPPGYDVPYSKGDEAYSRILTGDSVGMWIKVVIRRVHNDGKLDIFVPSFKKYKVYAHALEVPGNLVLRHPPLNALREDSNEKNELRPDSNEKVETRQSNEPIVPEIPSGVVPEKFTLDSGNSLQEDTAAYRETQAKIQAAVNKALGLTPISPSIGDFEPDFMQLTPTRSSDDDEDEDDDGDEDDEEDDEDIPEENHTLPNKTWNEDFASTSKNLVFDNDQETKALGRMGAVVGFLLSMDTDEKSSRAQELARLWNALDLDQDGQLNDNEILNMQLSIAEAWKQKAQIEFDEMLNKMDNPLNKATRAQLESVTNQFRQEMLQDLEDRKKDIQENKERYIEELRSELDIDMDGIVSKDDFLKTAPFVLYDQS